MPFLVKGGEGDAGAGAASAAWARDLALRGAEGFRASQPHGLLGHFRIDSPRDGSVLTVDKASGKRPFPEVQLKFSIEATGALDGLATLVKDAMMQLCGSLFGEPALQLSADDCAVFVTLHSDCRKGGCDQNTTDAFGDATIRFDELMNGRSVALDSSRCGHGRCRLSAMVVDGEGQPLLSKAQVTVYFNELDDSSSSARLLDPVAASSFAALPFSVSQGAAEGGYLGAGLVFHALAYAQRPSITVIIGSISRPFVPGLIRRGQLDSSVGGFSRAILVDPSVQCGKSSTEGSVYKYSPI